MSTPGDYHRAYKMQRLLTRVASAIAVAMTIAALLSFSAREIAREENVTSENIVKRTHSTELSLRAEKENLAKARSEADDLIASLRYDLGERLDGIASEHFMRGIDERIALYRQHHPLNPIEAEREEKAALDKANNLDGLGITALQDKVFGLASLSFHQALELRKRGIQRYPSPYWLIGLSEAYQNLGDLSRAKGEWENARTQYQKGIETLQQPEAELAKNPQWSAALARSQGLFAGLLIEMPGGDTTEAARLIQAGKERLDALDHGEKPRWYSKYARKELEEVAKKLPKSP